jgi:hypothetical protein
MMPQVRECRLVLELRGDHLGFDRAFVAVGRSALDIVVVIIVAATTEVAGALVLVGTDMMSVFGHEASHVG